MSVHRAGMKEVKDILFVINQSNSQAYRQIIPPEHFKEPVLALNELLEDFQHMTFYTFKLGKKVIGVAALKIEGNIGQIRWVYILPEHQRKGVGTSLMIYIENQAEEMKLEKLVIPYVHAKAYWAKRFYEKLGYEIINKYTLPTGMHATYEKTLTNPLRP